MAESGFISLELSRSQAPVTISKTAILFLKQTMIPRSQLIYIALVVSLIP